MLYIVVIYHCLILPPVECTSTMTPYFATLTLSLLIDIIAPITESLLKQHKLQGEGYQYSRHLH
jgi:hypothetical protein